MADATKASAQQQQHEGSSKRAAPAGQQNSLRFGKLFQVSSSVYIYSIYIYMYKIDIWPDDIAMLECISKPAKTIFINH